MPQWSAGRHGAVQPQDRAARSARPSAARYSPGNYRVVSAAYRLQRGFSEQIDVGWQWPLNDLWGDKGQDLGPGRGEGEGRWYSVGRLNYSLQDRRLVDAVVGLEYDAGCWIGRVVFERLQSGTNSSQQAHPVPARVRRASAAWARTRCRRSRRISPATSSCASRSTTPSRFSNYD